jgi:hypothetical protein
MRRRGRIVLEYSRIEHQLVEALPELRPAAEAYWRDEGAPGEDSGPYILYESVFRPYITALLDIAPSPSRDRLLRRAFGFTDAMLAAGGEIRNLAGIAVFEGQPARWYHLAEPFLGPRARAEIEQWGWSQQFEGSLDIGVDLYAVATLVAALLERPVPDGAAQRGVAAVGRDPGRCSHSPGGFLVTSLTHVAAREEGARCRTPGRYAAAHPI